MGEGHNSGSVGLVTDTSEYWHSGGLAESLVVAVAWVVICTQ